MPEQLPQNLSVEALALSPAETRSFPRWYTDLLLRKRTDSVVIGDVLSFVDNFGISHADKRSIVQMFGSQLVTLDPVQFYVFCRLTGHILQGQRLRRELAYVAAPVPRPRSILTTRSASAKPQSDMDSFMSLMTGSNAVNGGVKKRKKRVTFDSRPPQVTEAAHRSMSELLRQSKFQGQLHDQLPQASLPTPPQPDSSPSDPDNDPEPDQPIANNQFAKVNIDSVLHHGQSMLPKPPAPRKAKAGDSFIQQLTIGTSQKPGHAPMQQQGTGLSAQGTGLSAQGTGLTAQGTGPQVPSLHAQYSGMQPGLQAQGTGIQQPQQSQHQQQMAIQTQYNGLSPQQSGIQPQGTGYTLQGAAYPRLQPQSNGFISPQLSGQFGPTSSPQNTGLQPQGTGQIAQGRLQPQGSGQFQGGQWQQQQAQGQVKLGPQSTGSLPMGMQRPPPPPSRLAPPQQHMNYSNSVSPQITGGLPMQQPNLQTQQIAAANMANPQGQQTGMGLSQASMGQQPGMLSVPMASMGQPGMAQPGTGQQHGTVHPGMAQGGMSQPLMAQQSMGQSGMAPQQAQVQPGMQFLSSVQQPAQSNAYQIAPPVQYARQTSGQAYNMQGLRNQLPNW